MSSEHRSEYNSPPPLRVEEVLNGLICSVCFGIPMKPKITPCEHVFCDGCAENALAATAACPNCRMPCERKQLRPMPRGTFMHRAWSTVMVKCLWNENGCFWTGSIDDATNHIGSCVHGQDNDNPRILLIQCEEENTMLKQRNSDLESEILDLESEILELEEESQHSSNLESEMLELEEDNTMLKQRNSHLENEILELNQRNSILESAGLALYAEMQSTTSALERKVMELSRDPRMELPILLDDDYDFGRDDVVALSQLISRYLEDIPYFIDSNRIFMCVRNCYRALEKSYKNNPEYYEEDMRMLISTCKATVGWFTTKQSKHIDNWLLKQGWD